MKAYIAGLTLTLWLLAGIGAAQAPELESPRAVQIRLTEFELESPDGSEEFQARIGRSPGMYVIQSKYSSRNESEVILWDDSMLLRAALGPTIFPGTPSHETQKRESFSFESSVKDPKTISGSLFSSWTPESIIPSLQSDFDRRFISYFHLGLNASMGLETGDLSDLSVSAGVRFVFELSSTRPRSYRKILIETEPPNAAAWLDGKHGKEFFATLGRHVIKAKLDGHAPCERKIILTEGIGASTEFCRLIRLAR